MQYVTLIQKIQAADQTAVAAIDESGLVLSYGDLRERANDVARAIGSQPMLVLLEGRIDAAWLVSYAACLLGGHPVLIVPPGQAQPGSKIMTAFMPDVVMTAGDGYLPHHVRMPEAGEGRNLHPDLAVLLSTSGSTGSAKCVRLSLPNISSNASSIAEFLSIGADERGVVSLPTHYSYGLSVVNSHLWAGARLLFTPRSVMEPEFWAFCARHGATSFAGVPYSYELLKRVELRRLAPRTLRYMTQAGGRLPVELARHYAALAAENGWRFYVMYGQTEATARMAYLPPDLLNAHPDCIGVAIPGGRFEVIDPTGLPVDMPMVPGELVYFGPNVMMGYASDRADLALGCGSDRLATGDIAQWTGNGLLQITGRLNRFIKVFGNRIGLDDVERLLEQAGLPVKVTGVDERLLVVTRDASSVALITETVCARLHLPRDRVFVHGVADYPLLPSGKIDYTALKALLPADDAQGTRVSPPGVDSSGANPAATARGELVRGIFADVFGPFDDEDSASFQSLGGDSLRYLSTVTALEKLIPDLPADWPERPLSQLVKLAEAGDPAASSVGPSLPRNLDSIRSFACILVVMLHVVGWDTHQGLRLPEASLWHRFMDLMEPLRMPLFTGIAGFLYSVMPARRGGFVPYMRGKIDLLLWPMLFAALFYWALRSASGTEARSLSAALFGGYLHLWYVNSILAMFALASLLDSFLRMTAVRWAALLALLLVLCTFMPLPHFLVWPVGLKLFPFFLLGILMHRLPALWNGLVPQVISGITLVALAVGAEWLPDTFAVAGDAVKLFSGAAALILFVSACPRVRPLERIALYTFTIYLWHPAANAFVRETLRHLGGQSVTFLFVVGTVAGVLLPIMMYKVIVKLPPWISRPVIGR